MSQFAYGFSMTLLHSLWQSAILLFLFFIIGLIFKNQQPDSRRKFLYVLIIVQLVISVFTFLLYYSEISSWFTPVQDNVYISFFEKVSFIQTWAHWLVYCYILVVAYKSIYLTYHWNCFKNNCSQTLLKPSSELKLFTLVKAQEFGIRKKITLWYSNKISSPVTFGFFKPVILMPFALVNQLTVEEAESLIIHELTHIKSNDYLFNFILIVSETLYFFNPFMRVIAGYIRLEREKNCDLQVLHFKYSPLNYAETLLKAARLKPVDRKFVIAAVSGKKQLLKRILFFTNENNLHVRNNSFPALSGFFILLVFCINIFAITEIKRDRTKPVYAYTPTIAPGYNADHLSSIITDNNPGASLPLIEMKSHHSVNGNNTSKNNTTKETVSDEVFERADDALESIDKDEDKFAMPVIATESETREVIINEENSGSGKKVTIAYKMIYINGQWVAYPIWTFTESKLKKDSATSSAKDSVIRPFHIIQ
ncbi:MAG: M56 family metallopeptidase [Ferruginibacter sp.]